MTMGERRAVEARVAELRPYVDAPAQPVEGLVQVAKLLLAFSQAAISDDQADQKAEAYADAIGDLPEWTIRAARRAWARGEVEPARAVSKVDCAFPPSPAQLRALALDALALPRGEMHTLTRMLNAEPIPQLTDEQRKANLARIKDLIRPRVGDDGLDS